MNHLKSYKLFESKNIGDIVGDKTIIDIFDPENDGYIEYMSKGSDDKYYFLGTKFDVIGGPYETLDDLYIDNMIEIPGKRPESPKPKHRT